MLIFLDRSRRGPDPWVGWKVGLFCAGAALGLVGMAAAERWLVFAAMGVLAVGVGLRFLPPSDEEAEADD